MDNRPLTKEQLRDLTSCVEDAHYEMCRRDECLCATTEEHQKNLAEGRLKELRDRKADSKPGE